MIEKLSYDELLKLSNSLSSSSKVIRDIINNYDDNMSDVMAFCDSIDSYVNFLDSSVKLYQDSDQALNYLIEKNK